MDDNKKANLRKLVKKELSKQEKLLVVLFYHEEYELTLPEIAVVMEKSLTEVSQMYSSIVMRLRWLMSKNA